MKRITIAAIAAGVILTVAGAVSIYVNHSATGRGVAPPTARWYPASTDFGDVEVGTYRDVPIRLKNVGGGTLTGNITVSAGDAAKGFSIASGGGPYSLGRHVSKNVTIRFTPPDSLAYAGQYSCAP